MYKLSYQSVNDSFNRGGVLIGNGLLYRDRIEV